MVDAFELRNNSLIKAELYHRVFTTESGKAVLEDLESLFTSSSNFNRDPMVMARDAGRADIVFRIKTLMSMSEDPDKYALEVETQDEKPVFIPPEVDITTGDE